MLLCLHANITDSTEDCASVMRLSENDWRTGSLPYKWSCTESRPPHTSWVDTQGVEPPCLSSLKYAWGHEVAQMWTALLIKTGTAETSSLTSPLVRIEIFSSLFYQMFFFCFQLPAPHLSPIHLNILNPSAGLSELSVLLFLISWELSTACFHFHQWILRICLSGDIKPKQRKCL